ncbi:MAG: Gfo/Idh/MocA family oxidoreductase [Chloroflexota bacterium]
MTVRIGVVGSRFIANAHAQGIARTPGATLVAAASPNPDHVGAFCKQWGAVHAFSDYREMLASDEIDAVTVACPNDLHAEVTIAAAKAGKHVLVDKPLAVTLEECDRMIEACKAAGVVLLYGENLCFAPKYVRAKQLADEGALGDVYYVRQLECHYGPHADWFWDVERSGGGVLMDMGCHSIAFCRWVFGNAAIESVSAEAATFVHGEKTRGDDHSTVVMRFVASDKHPKGGIGIAENSWARAGGFDDRAEIYGTQGLTIADITRGGSLQTFSAKGYGYAAEKSPWTRGWTWTTFEESWNYGFPQEIAHFVDCIENGTQPMLTGEDGRETLLVICAAYLSARTGRKERLSAVTDLARKPVDFWLRA